MATLEPTVVFIVGYKGQLLLMKSILTQTPIYIFHVHLNKVQMLDAWFVVVRIETAKKCWNA